MVSTLKQRQSVNTLIASAIRLCAIANLIYIHIFYDAIKARVQIIQQIHHLKQSRVTQIADCREHRQCITVAEVVQYLHWSTLS